MIDFKRHRFPPIDIIKAVRWYLRFKFSLSDVVEFLIERNVNVSREAVRKWVQKFGPQIANCLDKNRRRIRKQYLSNSQKVGLLSVNDRHRFRQ